MTVRGRREGAEEQRDISERKHSTQKDTKYKNTIKLMSMPNQEKKMFIYRKNLCLCCHLMKREKST